MTGLVRVSAGKATKVRIAFPECLQGFEDTLAQGTTCGHRILVRKSVLSADIKFVARGVGHCRQSNIAAIWRKFGRT